MHITTNQPDYSYYMIGAFVIIAFFAAIIYLGKQLDKDPSDEL